MTPLVLALVVQAACPNETSARAAVDSGWRAYRGGAATDAAALFARADSLCPGARGAATGLGFAQLRLGRWDAASATLRRALRADSADADAWTGLGLASRRLGRRDDATAAFRRALRIAPDYADAEEALLDLGAGVTPPRRARPDTATIPARVSGERFEVRTGPAWSGLYVQGINLGAALPGKFPADFPTDDSTYARWLALMAGAHANVVRLYTILPPAFYRALAQWNGDHPDQPLWLVQGVWTELPPHNAYDAPAFRAGFVAELRRAADVVHGRARLPRRPGHAWGRYTADVSARTLAWLVGREWEPQSLQAYDSLHRDRTRFAGRFLAVDSGTATDVWLAQQCDTLLAYEWDVYHAQRPIAYVTWPTLDPLSHVTEPGRAEEQALRRRYGFPPNPRLKEYANDGVTLDAMRVRVTAADPAGYFAAYHAYPYYPDFIGLDSAYG
ncbi:MAG TPA: tetratricopeptide repeat protein, partial [Gemmatimonadales bacterium]|nr:tetratricopeptide repeat protein [Gemmatimonadales bacterium]